MIPCKIPLALLHVKEPSLYGAIPLRAHPDNAGKIKFSLRHGRESGNGKTGTRKGCQETGMGKTVFSRNGEKMGTGNAHFSRQEFPVFSRPAIWLKNNVISKISVL